jgi:hypothetical protein
MLFSFAPYWSDEDDRALKWALIICVPLVFFAGWGAKCACDALPYRIVAVEAAEQ